MEKVFVYGTLLDKNIRFRITGRNIPKGIPDGLDGFSSSILTDDGMCYPIITKNHETDEIIEGELIEVTSDELKRLDNYEGDQYRRIKVKTRGGHLCWVYCR